MKKLVVTIETRIRPTLFNAFACVGYWNENGQRIYDANKAGKMGSAFTQAEAKKLSFEDFVFNSLLEDFKTLATKFTGYKFGRGGSHIWISNEEDNARAVFITFN